MTLLRTVLKILTMLLSLTAAQNIANLADQRCPCRAASECRMNFAETNPLANNAVQQYVPACPALQGRCCTPETMLVTIIDLVQLQQQQFAQFNQPQFAQSQFAQPQSIQHQSAQPQFAQPQFVDPLFVELEHQYEQPLPQLPLSRSGGVRGSNFLSCVSVDQCSAGNIYGTNPKTHCHYFPMIWCQHLKENKHKICA